MKIDYITQVLKASKAAERHVTLKHVVVKTGMELRNACSVWRYSTIFLGSFTFAKQTGFLSPGRRYVPHRIYEKCSNNKIDKNEKSPVTLKHVVVKTVEELRKSYFVWRYSTICLSLYTLAKQTGFLAPGRRCVPHN